MGSNTTIQLFEKLSTTGKELIEIYIPYVIKSSLLSLGAWYFFMTVLAIGAWKLYKYGVEEDDEGFRAIAWLIAAVCLLVFTISSAIAIPDLLEPKAVAIRLLLHNVH